MDGCVGTHSEPTARTPPPLPNGLNTDRLMESIQKLLSQVRRKQLLLCAYPATDGNPEGRITLERASQALELGSAECLQLVRRLHQKQLIERMPTEATEPLILTARGQRLVQRMSGNGDQSHPLLE